MLTGRLAHADVAGAGWRSVFLVNGALTAAAVPFLPRHAATEHDRPPIE